MFFSTECYFNPLFVITHMAFRSGNTQDRGRSGVVFATVLAILAAVFYAVSSPVSKVLLESLSPTMMASLLYLGAGIGLSVYLGARRAVGHRSPEPALEKPDMPYVVGMVVLDIAAPILLMVGLSMTSAANASLLNNFEIVATSLVALVVFKEAISPKLWCAIMLVTVASIMLSVEDLGGFVFSTGSLFVLAACVCWGFENNCTRMISSKDPVHITVIKGMFSGLGSLVIAAALGELVFDPVLVVSALCLGFVSYGLSITCYIRAQRDLGAARVSAYYAIAPFIGVTLSLLMFREMPGTVFIAALAVMVAGTWLIARDSFDAEKESETGSKAVAGTV